VITLALGSLLASGCSTNRFTRNGSCALVGTGVGGAAGIIYMAADDGSTAEVLAAGAIGAAVGAAVGYGICVATDN
jgi:hypothetical protein